MKFQFQVNLTDEDYLNFNVFHAFESKDGQKNIRKSRIIFLSIIALVAICFCLSMGLTSFTVIYTILIGLFALVYMLFFKKIITKNLKGRLQQQKKQGKLPFDPAVTFELYDETFAEQTDLKRAEQSYQTIERICILNDQYIYLYNSSISAYILPVSQVAQQVDLNELTRFLITKCNNIEYY